MFALSPIISRFVPFFSISFVLICICQTIVFKSSTVLLFSLNNETALSNHTNPPNDNFTHCLIHAEKVFTKLSLQWFLAFGTALMYHRSKNFISDDIDIGIFHHDFLRKNIQENTLILVMRKCGYKLLAKYGQMNDGQGWTFRCPTSNIRLGIFVFYPIDFKISKKKSFIWWTASYNGPCATMPYGKCRRGFSDITLDRFQMCGKSFDVASKQFLIDQYGTRWNIPRKYSYSQSFQFMPNLIDEH